MVARYFWVCLSLEEMSTPQHGGALSTPLRAPGEGTGGGRANLLTVLELGRPPLPPSDAGAPGAPA